MLLDACIMLIKHNFAINVCNLQKINSSCSKCIMVSDFFLTSFVVFVYQKFVNVFGKMCFSSVKLTNFANFLENFDNHLILKF